MEPIELTLYEPSSTKGLTKDIHIRTKNAGEKKKIIISKGNNKYEVHEVNWEERTFTLKDSFLLQRVILYTRLSLAYIYVCISTPLPVFF